MTSTDSGLAVPDWPLSYGTWFPPMVGGILYEHGHRMIAGLVGMLMLALAVWLWRAESRRWVRMLGYSALGAVIIQALLGGVTVLLLLPPAVSIAHACIGPTVFCLVVALARCTAPSWDERVISVVEENRRPSLRVLGIGVSLLAAIQLILGAVIRHTGLAVSAHIGGAAALTVSVGWLSGRVRRLRKQCSQAQESSLHLRRRDFLRRPRPTAGCPARSQASVLQPLWIQARRLVILLGAQLVLGISVFAHRSAVLLKTAHHGIGILIVVQTVMLAWELMRHTTRTASVGDATSQAIRVQQPSGAASVEVIG